MGDHIGGLVREWVYANVHNYPLEDKPDEVRRQVLALSDHMMGLGYTRDEVEDHIGDLYDFLEARFEEVQDLNLGFKDPPDR